MGNISLVNNIKEALEIKKIIKEEKYLSSEGKEVNIKKINSMSRHPIENYTTTDVIFKKMSMHVRNEKTLDTVFKERVLNSNNKITALNFANGLFPGGDIYWVQVPKKKIFLGKQT